MTRKLKCLSCTECPGYRYILVKHKVSLVRCLRTTKRRQRAAAESGS